MLLSSTRKNGFLCYAHCGGNPPIGRYVEELRDQLDLVQPQHPHPAWCDRDLTGGEDWPTEIRKALDSAAYAVLFVNAEFLLSEFITQVELPSLLDAAQREGLLLLPLRVGECPLPDWLARVQFLNEEEGDRVFVQKRSRARLFKRVADRVKEFLNGPGQPSQGVRLMETVPSARGPRASNAARGPSALVIGSADSAVDPVKELADALSDSRAEQLDAIRERYLCGERRAGIAALEQLIESPSWNSLNAGLRGRILRTAALYRLGAEQDLVAAQELAERAVQEDPRGDHAALDVHLALWREGTDVAFALLDEPKSQQALHLKAGFLIEHDRAEEALALLDWSSLGAGAFGEPTAETWRLRALAHLTQHRLVDAVEAIEHARKLSPDWLAVRAAGAVVAFWRACTPAAYIMSDRPLLPMPFPQVFVRADSAALSRLQEAERIFADVAALLREGSDEERHWSTWRLVTLLALGNHERDATALAERLLAGMTPVPVWPLLWAHFYGLDLDWSLLKERLRETPTDDANFLLLRGIYFELCLDEGEAEGVLDELSLLKPLLSERERQNTLLRWQALALIAAGKATEALHTADAVEDEAIRLRLRLHIARKLEWTERGSHCAAIDALLAVDSGPDVLGEACEAHARTGDWAFVAEHADALLEVAPTPSSLRMLVSAAWNLGNYRRCIEVLDTYRDVYPEGRLPQDLALLRVRCQRLRGDIFDAVREARALFERRPTAEHLVELLNTQVSAADQTGMQASLMHLLAIDGADGDLLLQGARLAVQVNGGLAVALWRKATSVGSDLPGFAADTALLGGELGLGNDETGPWFQRMAEQAAKGEGNARMLHVSELVSFAEQQREASQYQLDLYQRGRVPVQALPLGVRKPLPVWFHEGPTSSRTYLDPARQWPVLIRHGARPLGHLKLQSDQQTRLILDLTALLTAQSLVSDRGQSLLDLIEEHFAPIWLPHDWHWLLRAEIDRLRTAQPRQLAAHRRIAELVLAGGIDLLDLSEAPAPPGELVSLLGEQTACELSHAREQNGRWVTYLPLRSPDRADFHAVELPEEWREWVLGPRYFLDLILADGLIGEQAYQRGLAELPPEPENAGTLPEAHARLLVSPILLESFVEAELLAVLANRFRLAMPADEWHTSESVAARQQQLDELADWTQGLIERVAEGLEQIRFRLLPASSRTSDESAPNLLGLSDLLQHKGQPGDLVWIDDRFLNGFSSTGTSRIIGVAEILGLLRSNGAINSNQRYDWLAKLRAGNYRFIPLESGEILHWLRKSHVDAGQLIVRKELKALARYWAACLYQGDALQWQGDERSPQGEIPFVISSQKAINDVLLTTWGDRRLNPNRKGQRADWILNNLYVGMAGIQHLIPGEGAARNFNLIGTDIGHSVLNAFLLIMDQLRKGQQNKRFDKNAEAEAYLKWVVDRVVLPRLLADPLATAPAASTIRASLSSLLDSHEEELWSNVLGGWMLRFLRILPGSLRKELHKDQALMQRLGLTEVTVLQVGDQNLPAEEFWDAVSAAMQERTGIVHTMAGTSLSVQLVPYPDPERPELELSDKKGRQCLRGYFKHSELLSPGREVRLGALRRHPEWWDGQQDGIEVIERRLSEIENPHHRIDFIGDIASASADDAYQELAAQWQRDRGAQLVELLPPAQQAILSYLRLGDLGESAPPDLHASWLRLEETIPPERGLFERLRRFCLLPCALTEQVLEAVQALVPEEAAALLKRLGATLRSPIGRLHLLDLSLTLINVLPEALNTAQSQVNHLLSPGRETDIRLLASLVELSWRALDNARGEDDPPTTAQLLSAWIHASFVADLILTRAADAGRVVEQLRRWTGVHHRDLYANPQAPRQDLAWPLNFPPSELCLVGLGGILARHPNAVGQLCLDGAERRINTLLTGGSEIPPDIELLRSPYLPTDRLGCLWGGDRAAKLRAFVDPEAAAIFSKAAFGARIAQALDALTNDPSDLRTWVSLSFQVSLASLSNEATALVDAALSQLPLDRLAVTATVAEVTAVLNLAVTHAQDRERIVRCLLGWAEAMDSGEFTLEGWGGQNGAGAEDAFADHLIQWSLLLAARHPVDPDAEFARMIDGLMLRSKRVCELLMEPLVGITRTMPFARHKETHRSLLCARARV